MSDVLACERCRNAPASFLLVTDVEGLGTHGRPHRDLRLRCAGCGPLEAQEAQGSDGVLRVLLIPLGEPVEAAAGTEAGDG